MRAHWVYLGYVLLHKWYVFIESLRFGCPLLGIIHDLSKFSPVEWGAYIRSFYNPDGSPRRIRDKEGNYDPTKISLEFDYAWLHHQKNKHHWQYWVLVAKEDKVLPIPPRYCREMLADWSAMGKARGQPNVALWYLKNRDKMRLHPSTREWLEEELKLK